MLENDEYCTDILMQSSAVGAAINAFNREIIDSHIKGCVTKGIQEGDSQITDELVDLLHKLMK